MLIEISLWINISLLILHEMDAVFRKEWKMMNFLQNVEDEKAHIIFTAAHMFLHLGFGKHRFNDFKNFFS